MKPRTLLLALACAAGLAVGASRCAVAEPALSIGPIEMTVSDLDRSVTFFTSVLDFKLIAEREDSGDAFDRLEGIFGSRARVATLALGDERFELTEYLVPKGREFPTDSRSNDRWFQHIAIVVGDMDRAYARVRTAGVPFASTEPQRIPDSNVAAAGIRAFYFRDPDGHYLELIFFPPGKGNAKWHAGSPRLFLGIDHTAIGVSDTNASLGFYRDLLGMHVAGESDNVGTEQEHLSGVFGAHVRITALRATAGPGIELLQYLAPSDGRPIPSDERPNDLASWQTTVTVRERNAAESELQARGVRFLSLSGIDALGALVLDPDGHEIRIKAP